MWNDQRGPWSALVRRAAPERFSSALERDHARLCLGCLLGLPDAPFGRGATCSITEGLLCLPAACPACRQQSARIPPGELAPLPSPFLPLPRLAILRPQLAGAESRVAFRSGGEADRQ